jgi:ankyrin repeat protein
MSSNENDHDMDVDDEEDYEDNTQYRPMLNNWLTSASNKGSIPLVEIVRSFWPNINLDTGLLYAISSNRFKMCKYLILLGANLSIEDDYMPIRVVNSGNVLLVKYFIRLGVVLNVENDKILDKAVVIGNLDLVKFLITEIGFKANNDSLDGALYYNHLDIAVYLIKLGARIRDNITEYFKDTRETFHTSVLPFILSSRTFNSYYLNKALDWAIDDERYPAADVLITYGANIIDIDKKYLTEGPLERVIFWVQREPSLAKFVTSDILNKLRDKGYTDIANFVVEFQKRH